MLGYIVEYYRKRSDHSVRFSIGYEAKEYSRLNAYPNEKEWLRRNHFEKHGLQLEDYELYDCNLDIIE